MEKTLIATGKTIDLAVEAALAQLGLSRDDVSVQVLQQAKAGFLGFGAQPAKVQVTYEVPDPVVVPEKPKSALGSASRSNKPKVNNPAPAPEKKPEPVKTEKKPEQPQVPAEPKPAPKQEKRKKEIRQRTREATLLEKTKKELVKWKITCFFLGALVIGMFVIVLTGNRSPLAIRYEEQILNKYASWAEELKAKEDFLGEYLRQLEQSGIVVPEFVSPEVEE